MEKVSTATRRDDLAELVRVIAMDYELGVRRTVGSSRFDLEFQQECKADLTLHLRTVVLQKEKD